MSNMDKTTYTPEQLRNQAGTFLELLGERGIISLFAAIQLHAQAAIDATPEDDVEEALTDQYTSALFDFANGPLAEAYCTVGAKGDIREYVPGWLKVQLWPEEFATDAQGITRKIEAPT